MAQDTLLGFPAHTLPYRRGKFIILSTASQRSADICGPHFGMLEQISQHDRKTAK